MLIIGVLILIMFECLWYIPIYRKVKCEDKINKKKIMHAFLWGLIPAFIVSVLLSGLVGGVAKLAGVSEPSLLHAFIVAFIEYGLIEELIKFLFSKISIRKLELSHINTVLIFGAVGMGFNILESTLFMATINPIAGAIFRGVCGGHIFYQLWMGYYVWLAWQAKKTNDIPTYRKNMFIGIAIPILVHGLHDFASGVSSVISENGQSSSLNLIPYAVSFVIDMVFLVVTLKKVYKLTKPFNGNDYSAS